jgi:hypothetical protein
MVNRGTRTVAVATQRGSVLALAQLEPNASVKPGS